jgi:autotransporter-associated beta strand protein
VFSLEDHVMQNHAMGARRSTRVALLAVLACAVSPVVSAAIPVVSGDFASEVNRLKGLVFGGDSGLYVPPSSQQLNDFRSLATSVFNNDLATAEAQAAGLDYQLVQFNDSGTGKSYFLLREPTVGGAHTRGWGSFALNASFTGNALVQVPHPLFDTNTESMGAWVFQRAAAKGFMMAGAHRNANGFGTADVARLPGSVFHVVHEVWTGPSASTTAWQLHGYDEDNASFPANTSAVLSDGAGNVTPRLLALDQQLQARGFVGYAYNTLPANDPVNITINGGVAGSTFSPLAATTNDQGQYSRGAGGTFVHAEFAQAVRFSSANRSLAATAVAAAITGSLGTVKLWDGGNGDAPASWTGGAGANWSPNGLPASGDNVVIDNTTVAVLPAEMRLTATSTAFRSLTWNSNDSSALSNDTDEGTNSVINLEGDGLSGTAPVLAMGPDAVSATFTLSGTNTNATPGTGVLVVNLAGPGPVLVANSGATLNITAQITESAGPRTLEKIGDGTLVLGNATNSFTGGIKFSGGVVSIGAVTATGAPPAGTDADFYNFNGGTLRFTGLSGSPASARGFTVNSTGGTVEVTDPVGTFTINGDIVNGDGPGRLVKTGPGELRLRNAKNWTGGLRIVAGAVNFTNGNQLGAALPAPVADAIIFDGGFLRWGFTTSPSIAVNRGMTVTTNGGGFDVPLDTTTVTFNGIITGEGQISKTGIGTLALGGANTHTGGVNVLAGTLSITSALGLGGAPTDLVPGYLTLNNTRLRHTGNSAVFSGNRGVTLNGGGTIEVVNPLTTITLLAPFTGTGPLIKTGAGGLGLSGSSDFVGPTIVQQGTLGLGSGLALGALPDSPTPNLIMSGGTTLVGNGTFTLSSNRQITSGPGGLTVDVPIDTDVFGVNGVFTGDTLNKVGAGVLSTLRLAIPNVTVTAGTLRLSADAPAATVLNALALSGGLLDAANNDFVVNYSEASPIGDLITAYLNAQIIANGDDGNGLPTYLAFAEAADLGITDFGGVAVDETSVLVKFTYVGDANLDGQVDALDYERVDLAIGNSGVFGTAQGDLNYDGSVDALDYEQIDLNIGNGVGAPLAPVFVPEPAGVAVVAGLAGLLGRRRR